MPFEMTPEQVRDYCRRNHLHIPAGLDTAREKRRSKYGNVRVTTADGTFDSRYEERCWRELQLRQKAGEFVGLARQVRFQLPGGVTYIADFVTLSRNGEYAVYDAKSDATRKDKTWCLKKRQMRECLGIDVKEL